MKRIKITDIGNYSEDQFDKVLRFAVLRLNSLIVNDSPVDEGGFRENWQIGQNIKKAPILPPPYSKTGQLPPKKINYQKEKAGNVYTLINPLPYAEAVCYGTNTPPSWGGVFRSRQGKAAGWPNINVAKVANEIKKFKPK